MNNVTSLNELNELKNKYLSKTGLITVLNSEIKNVPNGEKIEYGMKFNEVRNLLNEVYETNKAQYEED